MQSEFFATQDFDLAAALLTAGVRLTNDAGQPIEQVFSESFPMGSSLGRRGVQLAKESTEGINTDALHNAYQDAEADRELDRAIEGLPISDNQKRELLQLAQLSAMSYMAHAFRNRKILEDAAGKTSPLIEVAKGGRFALVPAHGRSDEMNRKLMAKIG